MTKYLAMSAVAALLVATPLAAELNHYGSDRQNSAPDKNPAIVLASPDPQQNPPKSESKSNPHSSQTNTSAPDPNWVLVLVGCVTCFVVSWQSWETRRAARAANSSAEAALIQIKLQAIAMSQWVDVRCTKVEDPKRFRNPFAPYNVRRGSAIEISVEAVNRTAYPLTFKKIRVMVTENGTGEEFIFVSEKETRLIPGDFKGSRVGFLMTLNLGEAANAQYQSGEHLQFTIVGDLVFTPAVGGAEIQEFGFLAEPGPNEDAQLPMIIDMIQEHES